MSYDLYLEYPPCAHTPEPTEVTVSERNPTYNFSAMLRRADRRAGGDGYTFDAIAGLTGRESCAWFEKIAWSLIAHQNEIEPLEPSNGWGTYERLRAVIGSLWADAVEHPNAIWTVYGTRPMRGTTCAGRKMVVDAND